MQTIFSTTSDTEFADYLGPGYICVLVTHHGVSPTMVFRSLLVPKLDIFVWLGIHTQSTV